MQSIPHINYLILPLGIGAGAGSSIFGFLTRTTLPDERARVFAAVMACRQAGLLIGELVLCIISAKSTFFHLIFKQCAFLLPGPAFNIFLRLCDFKLGPFVVNKYTSPGVSLLWLISH